MIATTEELHLPLLSRSVRRCPRWLWIALAIASTVCLAGVVTLAGPLHSAIQIGGDEFFEVNKGLLWAKGFRLYKEVWNDQPPLHTIMLGMAFRWFGPTIGVARALAVWFGLLLWAALFSLVKRHSGKVGAFTALACLIAAPQVLMLSVSVMLEAPAIAVGLCAVWAVFEWEENRHPAMLAFSGLLLAAAMQIKLTAGIVAPALALQILLASRGESKLALALDGLRTLAFWGFAFLASFVALGFALGESFDLLWTSHFSSDIVQELNEENNCSFSFQFITDHTEAIWGVAAAVFIAAARREWRTVAFPLSMLLTVMAIHLHHRPWWPYYYLHFAVPIAWLTGYAVAGFLGTDEYPTAGVPLGSTGNRLMAAGLITLLVFSGGSRLVSEVERILHLPKVEDSALLAKMKYYGPNTRWTFADGAGILPFHARLLVIPQLAVIPATRVWSGRISEAEVLALVKRYRPEQLLLTESKLGVCLNGLAETEYVCVQKSGKSRLFVSKSIFDSRKGPAR
ncbi:MAG TPA: glycosyltransferase family 39 protein [Verrucomicrobiae bacterium]|nr:glycosyltransferase family 39 protein [Verrucomicrobiae bacterium]